MLRAFRSDATSEGGSVGQGVVFSLDLNTDAGGFLYSFCNQRARADGEYPSAALVGVKGHYTALQPQAAVADTVRSSRSRHGVAARSVRPAPYSSESRRIRTSAQFSLSSCPVRQRLTY
jgi:hypothetical protein